MKNGESRGGGAELKSRCEFGRDIFGACDGFFTCGREGLSLRSGALFSFRLSLARIARSVALSLVCEVSAECVGTACSRSLAGGACMRCCSEAAEWTSTSNTSSAASSRS